MAVPPIPSPVSPGLPYGSIGLHSSPLRPQPIKPAGYPQQQVSLPRRAPPPPSSAGYSSDEGDFAHRSKPDERDRQAYVGSVNRSAPPPVSSQHRARQSNGSRGFPSHSSGAGGRHDRSPSPPSARAAPPSTTIRRNESFSRTRPPESDYSSSELSPSATEDDRTDSEAAFRVDHHSSSSFAPATSSTAAGRYPYASESAFAPSPSSASSSRRPLAIDLSEPELSSDDDQRSVPFRVPARQVVSGAGSASGRTMVSKPGGASRTMVSSGTSAGRGLPGSRGSLQFVDRQGPSGFSGFDERGGERRRALEHETGGSGGGSSELSARELGRTTGSSAQRYGKYNAPVGRRMARQLGM